MTFTWLACNKLKDLRIPWHLKYCTNEFKLLLPAQWSAKMFVAKGANDRCTEQTIHDWKTTINNFPFKQVLNCYLDYIMIMYILLVSSSLK